MLTTLRSFGFICRISCCLAVTLACQTAVGQTAPPYDLKISEGFRNPLGFYDSNPTFSWRLPADDDVDHQKAFRIVVGKSPDSLPATAEYWDSGKITTNQSLYIPYGGKPLASRERLHWKVQYWDATGRQSAWSQPAHFEMGLLTNSDWQAHWIHSVETDPAAERVELISAFYGVKGDREKQIDITKKVNRKIVNVGWPITVGSQFAGKDPAPGEAKSLSITCRKRGETLVSTFNDGERVNLQVLTAAEYTPAYLRKEFSTDAPIVSARLYVTAKGVFEAWMNGQRIGDDYMTPGWTPYHTRIETLTYDVTSHLQEGNNSLGLILGEGWYAGRLMNKKDVFPSVMPMALAQLEIRLSDGTTQVVTTDKSWRSTTKGPLRFSMIYDGEEYDQSREMPGWSQPGFDDSGWSAVHAAPVNNDVQLVPKRHFTVQSTDELPALDVRVPEPGKFIFDLGQNIVGWPRLRVPCQAGQPILVRFAEMLNQDGTVYTANYRSAKSTDRIIPAKTGIIEWHPTFTFHGFRYVEVSGVPNDTEPELDWVTGVALHSNFKQTGRFHSSHDKLNRLQKNITWGQRGNYLDIPTDCPQRDERLGWTGDAQVFCPTSLFNYDVHSFWASWLQSVREEQSPKGGVPNVVPNTLGQGTSPGWGDVAVVAPWEVYIRTGDHRILRDSYEMMSKWTAFYETEAKDWIVNRKGFGDWLQPYPESDNPRSDTPFDLIATAYFGRCAALMHKTAVALERPSDASKYENMHRKIREAFSAKFFDTQGQLKTQYKTQTGYLLALAFDLLEPELKAPAAQHLLRMIDKAEGHLRTGFLGTPLLAPQLDRLGHSDIAYSLLFKETYPSWFFSINQGATTMWERWNSYSHKDGFGKVNMNSFNHYAYGAIGQWMYERVAGLAPDPTNPGYKHFFVQPNPGGPLTSASASLETPYGKASCAWEKQSGNLMVTAEVPPNTTATFIPPESTDGTPKVSVFNGNFTLKADSSGKSYKLTPGRWQLIVE